MRFFVFALLQFLVFMPIASLAADNAKAPTLQKTEITVAKKAAVAKSYGKLPLYFTENKGQVDGRVKYYEKSSGHATFFTNEGVVLALTKSIKEGKEKPSPLGNAMKENKDKKFTTEAVRLSFIGANKTVKITSESPLPGHVNYFIGNDKTKWQSNVPTYEAVTYENIYDNIDIKFYGNNKNIEHDIIVRPGGEPSAVRFAYEGIKGLKITEDGNLRARLADGEIIEKKPIVYQVINGKRKAIHGSYRILKDEDGSFTYAYDVAAYDHTKELVIDPVLVYSTYLGGSYDDIGNDIAVDSAGNIYLTGSTLSLDFPTTGPVQGGSGFPYWKDVFVTKIDSSGSTLIYSSYFGGRLDDYSSAIAVDASGNVYITGTTSSLDFPLVSPIQATKGIVDDVFVTKIDASGSAIVYSTFLGGDYTDFGKDIAIDATGAAYVTGETQSSDFPTKNPIAGGLPPGGTYPPDAFVSKINPAGSALVYSTYLGGSNFDAGRGIAVDKTGAAYITGNTSSSDYPTVSAMQLAPGAWAAFISKINPAGSALVYSTYLGGTSSDSGEDIEVDSSGAAYVTGSTSSSDFPLVSPIQSYTGTGYDDVFIAKVNPAGSKLVYSTCLGGSGVDRSFHIAVDSAGNAYVTGYTWSTDFPVVNPIQGVYGGGFEDAFVAVVDYSGQSFRYSTYLGGSKDEYGRGIAVDEGGNTYITGWTISQDFPLQSPLQAIKQGKILTKDAFISKIDGTPPPAVIMYINPDAPSVTRGSTLGYNVTATNTTTTRQCFNYWENVNLPGGTPYPSTGELFGPVHLCLDAGVSQTTHLTHGVPMTAPLGTYALNTYVGAYAFPGSHVVVSEAHFTFDVTTFSPVTKNPRTSTRLLKNGFK